MGVTPWKFESSRPHQLNPLITIRYHFRLALRLAIPWQNVGRFNLKNVQRSRPDSAPGQGRPPLGVGRSRYRSRRHLMVSPIGTGPIWLPSPGSATTV